jgi:hypothetical protein
LPLIAAAGASYFVLKQSNQNSRQQEGFFALMPYPANQGKPGLESLRLASPLLGLRFGKNSYALPTLWACFVFPDFD